MTDGYAKLQGRDFEIDTQSPFISEEGQCQGIQLKWTNLHVTVDQNVKGKQPKVILDNVSGYAKQGEVLAIMGPSGAGKTTLMAMLSKRLDSNKNQTVKGEVLMNNQTYDCARFSNNAAFILQTDILLDTMTVYECLMFAARLRLKLTEKQKEDRVQSIIRRLQLTHCQNTYVGGQFVKGISGGEKKRTCIAVELVANPQLILLDEPTSGLDSFTATILVTLLRNLAKDDGKNVVFTIHQPGSDIVKMFDRLLLLKNGQEVYQGPTGGVLEHMTACGLQVPISSNPADVFMQALQDKDEDTHFNAEVYRDKLQKNVLAVMDTEINYSGPILGRTFNNPFLYEFQQVARRSILNFKRNPFLLMAKLMQLVFMYFFYGTIWWQAGKLPECNQQTYAECQSELLTSQRNTIGFMFSLTAGVSFSTIFAITLTFPQERAIFLKEHNSNTYRVVSYFFGKFVADLPYTVSFPFLLAIGAYITGDLRWGEGGSGYFVAACVMVSTGMAATGLGLMNGALFSNVKVAIAVTPALLLPFMLFSGMYANLKSLPDWIGWIQYISFFRYCFEGLIQNQFNGLYYKGVDLGPIVTNNLKFSIPTWECIVILLGLAAFFLTLAFLLLNMRAKKIAA